MYSTVMRFKNGYINIAATVRVTARTLIYDEVSVNDITLGLVNQGVEIVAHNDEIADYGKNTISVAQIRRALSANFYYNGNGYYAISAERATEAWWKKYHKDDCPVHGFGRDGNG